MATIEASWSAAGPVPGGGPAIWGTQATLLVERQGPGRGLYRYTRERPQGERLDVPELPEGARNATEYFLTALSEDRSIEGLVSLEVGRDAQEILEAGLRAALGGREVSLPLPPYPRAEVAWSDTRSLR
jgi:predicted dehydrogenase